MCSSNEKKKADQFAIDMGENVGGSFYLYICIFVCILIFICSVFFYIITFPWICFCVCVLFIVFFFLGYVFMYVCLCVFYSISSFPFLFFFFFFSIVLFITVFLFLFLFFFVVERNIFLEDFPLGNWLGLKEVYDWIQSQFSFHPYTIPHGLYYTYFLMYIFHW